MSPVTREEVVVTTTVPSPQYTYRASVERVIDGDSLVVLVDLGFRSYAKVRVRMRGINSPEIGAPNDGWGLAKRGLIELLGGKAPFLPVLLVSFGEEKYGRWLCDIYSVDGVLLNEQMVLKGFAKRYP